MPILVTGGAGFIGSHLAERLVEDGEEVYVLDDLSTGTLANIRNLLEKPNFHFTLGSVLDASLVDELLQKSQCVYHLAAAVGVRLVFENPLHTIESNVRGAFLVLEAALRHGKKVLMTSTSEVYGRDSQDGSPFREEDDLVIGSSMRFCYASSKALDEFLARAYFLSKGLPVVIVRLFNTVGARQSGAYGMVIPRFVEQALLGKPITIYGDGKQVRSFAWVGDVVKAMVELMNRPDLEGEIFNVGSDKPITIEALAQKVKAKTKSDSPIVFIPYEQAYGKGFEDIRFRVPDISKLKKAIGYQPTKDIDEILDEVIEEKRHLLGALEGLKA